MSLSILLDTCALYPPRLEDKNAIEKLFELEDMDRIEKMEIAEPTEQELSKLNNMPSKIKNRIDEMIICLTKANTHIEKDQIKKMEKLLFPQKIKLSIGDARDALILFNALKYGHTHIVTANTKHFIDNGMSDKIYESFKIRTVTPAYCLKQVLDHLSWRKEHDEKMRELREQ